MITWLSRFLKEICIENTDGLPKTDCKKPSGSFLHRKITWQKNIRGRINFLVVVVSHSPTYIIILYDERLR